MIERLAEMWDAVVIGAGPAGSVSAALLAGRGWRVLLVERQSWPRQKACGGCVNAAGVRILESCGLGDALAGAARLDTMLVRVGERRLSFGIPVGAAVDRMVFDERLVRLAEGRGAVFVAETAARVGAAEAGFRAVTLVRGDARAVVRGRVVLCCDGQAGDSLKGCAGGGGIDAACARYQIRRPTRHGFATTLVGANAIAEHTITMVIREGQYVGLVRLPDGATHVGASLSAAACRAGGGPGAVVERLCPLGIPESARWYGTPALSGRREGVAAQRLLVVGDSCGYVEPFTGEGISWAIRGARAAVELLPGVVSEWPVELAERWQALHGEEIVKRQAWCKRFRYVLERPRLTRACMRAAQHWPWIPKLVARKISA